MGSFHQRGYSETQTPSIFCLCQLHQMAYRVTVLIEIKSVVKKKIRGEHIDCF